MPEYLAPGVYVEEIPGQRSIEGVSTSTAGFVGPTRFGPTSGRPELLTSYADFQRIFGGHDDLTFGMAVGSLPGSPYSATNHMAHAARGFFDEGGSRLYVSRTFHYTTGTPANDHAAAVLPAGSLPSSLTATVRARYPGVAGQMLVTFALKLGRNVLVSGGLTRVHEFDVVYAVGGSIPSGQLHVVRTSGSGWSLAGSGGMSLSSATAVYPATVLVQVQSPMIGPQGLPAFGPPAVVGEFGLDSRSPSGIERVLTANPPTRHQALTVPIALELHFAGSPPAADDAPAIVAGALFGPALSGSVLDSSSVVANSMTLTGGSDGVAPIAGTYAGDGATFNDYEADPTQLPFNGLLAFEALDDISIVVAPGACTGWTALPEADNFEALAIQAEVVTHCEKMRYRTAALETPAQLLPGDALDFRNHRSSDHAGLYYPWITIANPLDGTPLSVPPAGFMAGIWARSDNSRGVIKAPANEVVRSAIDFELRVNKAQQELLNPDGVNCLRYFPGAGFLVWGARTISDDPEWKYLSMRRYFNYLEHSIDRGTQWVVFEVNNEALWASVRRTVEDFLLNEWKSGALLGTDPKEAYFVRCDRSTMTQNDLDDGRLVCVIGVAAAKPAEFVIFRIGQWTATATN